MWDPTYRLILSPCGPISCGAGAVQSLFTIALSLEAGFFFPLLFTFICTSNHNSFSHLPKFFTLYPLTMESIKRQVEQLADQVKQLDGSVDEAVRNETLVAIRDVMYAIETPADTFQRIRFLVSYQKDLQA